MKQFTFLLSLWLCATINAQVHIGNAEGTNNTYGPFNAYYGYSYVQTIYKASDINASGDITAITFEMANEDAIANSDDNVDVWIGHTTKTEFDTTDDWVEVSSLTQVLTDGTITKSGTTVTITFSAPFNYNGTDNLILAYDTNEAGYDSSSDKFNVSSDAAGNNITLSHYSDSVNSDPTAPTTATVRTDNYADITFIGITQSCPTPTDLTASNITAEAADLGWTQAGTATTWNIEYGEAGFTQGSGTTVAATTTNPHSVSGLNSGTTYSFYVQADCGSGETSAWAGPFNFTTLCTPYTVAYSQNFDAETAPELNTCWTALVENSSSTYANVQTSETESNSADNSARFYSAADTDGSYYLISPNFSDLDNTKRIKFMAFKNFGDDTEGDVIEVGTMTDVNDTSTYTTLQTYAASDFDEDAWKLMTLNFTSYTGGAAYIAFKYNPGGTYNYFYIDDFVYDNIPSCAEPTDLTATDMTQTSAVLGWTESASATTWNIEYGASGFTQGNGTTVSGVTDNPYTLEGLTAGTVYSFYVQADCGSGDTSPWTGPFSFTTVAGSVAPPYSTSFEDDMPVGWTTEVSSGNEWNVYDGGGTYAHTGSKYLRYLYHSTEVADSWAFTIGFSLTAGTSYDVSFFQRVQGASWDENLKFTVGTEANAAAQTTVLIDLNQVNNTEHTERKVIFTPDADGVYYFGFQAYSEANTYAIIVDDFKIEEQTLFSLNEDSGLGNYAYSSVDWGDYDNDGDQDILIAGAAVGADFSTGASTTHVYDNDGSGNFSLNSGILLRGTHAGDARWVDYDSDGDLDILLLGIEYATSFTRYALYNNDGSGNFTAVEDVDNGVSWGSFAIGDYDNDGDIDYMMSGWSYGASANYSTYLFKNNDNTMEREDLTSTYSGVFDGRIAWEDIDNDMDLDMIMSPDPNSTEDIKPMRVYTNEGGSFTLSQEFANNRYNAATFGDFDNDGYVDMAITGADDSYNDLVEVFKNENGTFTSYVTLAGLDGGTGTTAAFGDYDNDGDLDLVVAGTNDDYDGETFLYINDNATFTAASATGFIAVGAGSLAWKDADGDLDIDLQVSGFYDDPDNGEYYSRSLLYTNKTETVNTQPQAPTTLASQLNDDVTTFDWSGASDEQTPETGLDYYLQVGTTSGGTDLASYAVRGTSWKLQNLPTDIDVYWCVKSIDTAFIESECSEEQVIERLSTNDVAANDSKAQIYPNPVTDYLLNLYLSTNNSDVAVKIFDVNAKLVLKGNYDLVQNKATIHLPELSSGVYFLQYQNKEQKGTLKFLVK